MSAPATPKIIRLTAIVLFAAALHVPGEEISRVSLPLADYLQLVEDARRTSEARQQDLDTAEPRVAEVVEQTTTVQINHDRAEVTTTYTAEVQGEPAAPVTLPATGIPWQRTITPATGSALASTDAGIVLAASDPGRYTVRLDAVADLLAQGGVVTLELAPVVAPVAVTEIDLPADRAWTCRGAVVASDTVTGDRRRLRLGLARGRSHAFELRREVRDTEAERALAQTVTMTLLNVRTAGITRHDLVLYEVARGSLDRFEVTLPPGLQVQRLATDEGQVPPLVEEGRLTVQRSLRLDSSGYLVLTSTPPAGDRLPMAPVQPLVPPRSHFLAVASSVAAELTPTPQESWIRVDLDDLPPALHELAGKLDLAAVWRCQGAADTAELQVRSLPAARLVTGIVKERTTTTLLTAEGTLLHRDLFSLARAGSALSLRLAAGTSLWSSTVNGMAVRVLERDGLTVVPLPFGAQDGTTVEVITVQRQALPPGRSQLSFGPPAVPDPVLLHRWQLLLPEANRYRYAAGDLGIAPLDTLSSCTPARQTRTAAPSIASPRSEPGTILPGTSSLRGIVTYEDGPMPGVTVTASNGAGTRSAISGVAGDYAIAGLPPGEYRVFFTLDQFHTLEMNIRVLNDQVHTVDAIMIPETVSEEIVVTSNYETISSGGTASSVIDGPASGHRAPSIRPRRPKQEKAEERVARQRVALARADLDQLRQGLVGGVKPVPVKIPTSGKALILAGALPPDEVRVTLDVKAGKEG